MLRGFGLSDKGCVRPVNEDRFAIDEHLGLCVIADGMGGHNAGEIASQLAVDAIVDVVRSATVNRGAKLPDERQQWPFGYDPGLSDDGNLLRTAVHVASLQIVETAASAGEYAGMGTTIVAARVNGRRLSVAHAGDSRLYVLSGVGFSQITADDSWIASVLADNPDADLRALQRHPMRNALTNVVGASAHTEVHVVERPISVGERLLLSTDGVHGVIDDRGLEHLLRGSDDPPTIARRLIAAAIALGSRDNCTAVVAQYRAA